MPKPPSGKRPRSDAKNSGHRPKTAPAKTSNATGFGSLCRVCANWFPNQSAMVPLSSRTILVNACTPAEVILAIGGSSAVEGGDVQLPEFCCGECFCRLEEAYRVRIMCRESERKLRKMLTEEDGINPLDAVEVVCKPDVPVQDVTESARKCCGCALNFPSLEALRAHSEAVHLPNRPPLNPERPFVCDICYHNFPLEQDLHEHATQLTSNVKKYVCAECGKRFVHPGKLSDHEKIHSGEKVFKCTECPAAFAFQDSLRKHVIRHKMPKDKFKCDECGRGYRSSKALKEHTNLHTGERPYVCTDCPKTFIWEVSFIKHIKMHRGQKDHECPICGKSFGDGSGLRQHVNFYHNQERAYGCFFCERRYPRKDYRRRHMESAHAAELLANPVPESELGGRSAK